MKEFLRDCGEIKTTLTKRCSEEKELGGRQDIEVDVQDIRKILCKSCFFHPKSHP